MLDEVSITVYGGSSAVIVGRNGAGKSTFLSILADYIKPDSGKVCGEKAAYCPQFDELFEDLTVKDNIRFWSQARGKTENSADFQKLLGVDNYLNKRVKHLSGGMKKCTAIVCALVGGELVLILDEPFSGLDVFYKNELLKTLKTLQSLGICIIYSAHNIDEVVGLNSEIYTLSNGKLEKFAINNGITNAALLDELLKKLD